MIGRLRSSISLCHRASCIASGVIPPATPPSDAAAPRRQPRGRLRIDRPDGRRAAEEGRARPRRRAAGEAERRRAEQRAAPRRRRRARSGVSSHRDAGAAAPTGAAPGVTSQAPMPAAPRRRTAPGVGGSSHRLPPAAAAAGRVAPRRRRRVPARAAAGRVAPGVGVASQREPPAAAQRPGVGVASQREPPRRRAPASASRPSASRSPPRQPRRGRAPASAPRPTASRRSPPPPTPGVGVASHVLAAPPAPRRRRRVPCARRHRAPRRRRRVHVLAAPRARRRRRVPCARSTTRPGVGVASELASTTRPGVGVASHPTARRRPPPAASRPASASRPNARRLRGRRHVIPPCLLGAAAGAAAARRRPTGGASWCLAGRPPPRAPLCLRRGATSSPVLGLLLELPLELVLLARELLLSHDVLVGPDGLVGRAIAQGERVRARRRQHALSPCVVLGLAVGDPVGALADSCEWVIAVLRRDIEEVRRRGEGLAFGAVRRLVLAIVLLHAAARRDGSLIPRKAIRRVDWICLVDGAKADASRTLGGRDLRVELLLLVLVRHVCPSAALPRSSHWMHVSARSSLRVARAGARQRGRGRPCARISVGPFGSRISVGPFGSRGQKGGRPPLCECGGCGEELCLGTDGATQYTVTSHNSA